MRFIENCNSAKTRVLNSSSSSRFAFFNLRITLQTRYITCLNETFDAIDPKIIKAFPKLGTPTVPGNSAVYERFGLTRRDAVEKLIEIAYILFPKSMEIYNKQFMMDHHFHGGSFPDSMFAGVLSDPQSRRVLQQFLMYLISLVEDKLTLSNQIVFNKKTVVIL